MLRLGLGPQVGTNTPAENSIDPDAEAYFARAGVTDYSAKIQISDFVKGIKNLGLYNSMVCWPLRSSQNAGAGTTAYSLGGLGTYNGTLTGGPTWGADGISFDGTDDYLPTGITAGFSQFSIFSIAKPDTTSGVMYEFSKDDVSSNREFGILATLGGFIQGFLWNPTNSIVVGPAAGTIFRSVCQRASSSINKLRRNNEADASGTTGTLAQFSANLTIGARAGGGGNYFDGTISASILFNTALSDSNTSSVYSTYKSTLGQGLGLP
jgi:hypothetical protein